MNRVGQVGIMNRVGQVGIFLRVGDYIGKFMYFCNR